ncbi:MAG: methylated-DNA--[protein]-cysteine S-methyltransferase [Ktedonobacterales bacterium]
MDTRQRPTPEHQPGTLGEARALLRSLRSLGEVSAPPTLSSAVLDRLGVGIAYFPLETSVGRIFVAYSRVGLEAVTRADTALDFEERVHDWLDRPLHLAAEPPATLITALTQHLTGTGKSSLRFNLSRLSEFERAVLLKALEIPRGEVRPYAWVAREIGSPKAVRAVGTALAHNPIPLFIPCHRVVRSDGTLGQYSMGGIDIKRAILTAEGLDPDVLERMAQAGLRYIGSDTDHYFCYPTCHGIRDIADQHRVYFASEREAAVAGYRPCTTCRPAAIA